MRVRTLLKLCITLSLTSFRNDGLELLLTNESRQVGRQEGKKDSIKWKEGLNEEGLAKTRIGYVICLMKHIY